MKAAIYTLIAITLSLSYELHGQSDNVSCATAFVINNPTQYCSGDNEFNSINAGSSGIPSSGCYEGVQNELWFEFTAIASAVNILVNGELAGTLQMPRVLISQGSCNGTSIDNIACNASDSGADVVNLFWSGLSVGTTYYIRVGGAGANQGSFQICVNNFNPPTEPGQDAETAAVLCDKAGFVIQALTGGGMDNDEAMGTCLDVGFGASENQSSWTTWIADNDAALEFTISPINASDDIDFVLYELPNGVDDFSGRIALRCMASSCVGPTGLASTSNDTTEDPGCAPGDDNFLQELIQEEGKAYALLINNFSNTGAGVSLEFGGDAEFKGPQPDFMIEVENDIITCDKIIEVIDNSVDNLGNLVAYEWNFGEDATPQTAQGSGPFDISYETFGTKFVVLTIVSDLGCRTTEIREIEVLPCCADASQVNIEVLNQQNIGCSMSELGSFSIVGQGGFPDYMYSFNGSEYDDLTSFSGLTVGDYEVGLIDRKGCEITRTVSIVNVNPITVDAGQDVSVEFLGDSIQLMGSYNADGEVMVNWTPTVGLNCEDGSLSCLDPVVTPQGTTTYTLIVSDNDGCITTDEVTIEVLKIRPLYAPNVFSPNEDGINDLFTLTGNPLSVMNIAEFSIFDRWGNKVFESRNLQPNDPNSGWDGKADNVSMDEGVYIWYAKIEFLDPDLAPEILVGDITLIR